MNVPLQHFGEHVLGLSQGSVSELLSKPKAWHMLSIKGREPFIRMQLWLNDPTAVDKLQLIKGELSNKRKRSHGGPGSGTGGDSGSDRSSPADPGDPYSGTGSADSPGSSSAKKPRVYFTDEQKEALKSAFALDPYPSTASMDFLSQELGLEARSIGNWFHNHRMRLKQQLPHGLGDNLALLAGGAREGQGTFDPMKFKLLVHQRMIEMQSPDAEAAANSPTSVASLLKQFTSLQQGALGVLGSVPGAENLATPGAGLDLSYKSRDGDDDDKDSIAESNEGSASKMEEDERARTPPSSQPQAPSSRSRRKPAAPQWVRPEWMGDGAPGAQKDVVSSANTTSSKDSLTINGVCVMNSLLAAAAAGAAPS